MSSGKFVLRAIFIAVSSAAIAQSNLTGLPNMVSTGNQYQDGFNNSLAYFQWFNSLTGVAYSGAEEGTNNSNLLPALLCKDRSQDGCFVAPYKPPNISDSSIWMLYCQAVETHFFNTNQRDAKSPEYKNGGDAAFTYFLKKRQDITGETALKQCAANNLTLVDGDNDETTKTKDLVGVCADQVNIFLKNCVSEQSQDEDSCNWTIALDISNIIDNQSP